MVVKYEKITEEMIERTRSRIGQGFVPREPYFNTAATKDTIRHFALGIGDPNPLWTDEAYAEKTRYGCIIAPPCFLYSVYWPDAKGACFPGIHGWHAGNDWEFFKPIRVGDSFSIKDTITDLVEKKKSEMAKRTFIGYCRTEYFNQRGELVATAKGWNVFAERDASRDSGKYSGIKRHVYTQEELKNIEDDYDREKIREEDPRYWEDIQIGEEFVPVVKGPLSMEDIICWLMGGGSPFLRAHGFALAYRRRHPKIQVEGGKVAEAVHFDTSTAQEVGLQYTYDYGSQRISWLGHLLTNWMGNDGFLKRLYAKLVGFNMVGDTTWCKGKVTKKYEHDEECSIDCQIWGENQRGQVTVEGEATIALPSKNKGIMPLDRR
jgi:acyl dehydratase